MTTLTSFQQFEIALIPITFLFSQILVLLIGLNIIGSDTWVIMGVPVLLGSIISILIGYTLNYKEVIQDIKDLESLFRLLVFTGGFILIPLLLVQIFNFFTYYTVFSVLTLIFSIIGGTMTISCILLFWHIRVIQEFVE